nr:hypothetical protein [Deltaproteobacteria bacterium]
MGERPGVPVVEQLAQARGDLRGAGRLVEGLEEAAAVAHAPQQAERPAGRVVRRVGLEQHVGALGLERWHLELGLDVAVRGEQQVEDVLGELIEERRHGDP